MADLGLTQAGESILEEIKEREARHAQDYFPRLAQMGQADEREREILSGQVRAELEDMKRAASRFRQAYVQTLLASDELSTRFREGRSAAKKRRIHWRPPVNSVIDFKEHSGHAFAQGLNFYKISLLIVVGSLVGVLIEMLWCLLTNGYLESRAGLVYGPFNILYGAGAVLLSAMLYRFRNRRALWSFLGGMVGGSALEYFCSWGQEFVLGSTSWDYSNMPFNLNGRICLLYSVFWGLLGLVWVKVIYPAFAALVLKIPPKPGRIITLALAIFMAVNCVVSGAALARWAGRQTGNPADTGIERLLDARFPDERMERIYANMEFGKKEE